MGNTSCKDDLMVYALYILILFGEWVWEGKGVGRGEGGGEGIREGGWGTGPLYQEV